MSNKITQSLLGGIVATGVMTAVMMIAPMMGMPKMSPPALLAMMMGVPIGIGWLMHFMIGITFALSYAFLFINVVNKIRTNALKGVIFGFAAFVFAQVAMAVMGAMFGGMPPMQGSMALVMIGSLMGHIIFGIVVALFVKEQTESHSYA